MARLTIILALACIAVIAANCMVSTATDAERTRAHGFAQAQMTLASAESARASAEASATRTAAALPMVAMAMAVILGLIALALPVTLFVLYYLHNQNTSQLQQPTQIIEQRTVMLLPVSAMSRRAMYQMLGNAVEVRQLEGHDENA